MIINTHSNSKSMLVIPNNFINFIEAVILDIENKKKCAYINYKKQKISTEIISS